jgi:hypothetical protein
VLQKTFFHAAAWNALNVFLYKIILQTHQACLFYVISKELFGISGTLFSTIYLLINLTNFGFDYSLFAFHQYYTTCQNNFKKMMHHFLLRSLVVVTTTLGLLLLLNYFSYLPQISFITQFTPCSLIIILTTLFISESIKKSLELFAHLSFLNKTITLVEIFTLMIYVGMVWSYYFLFGYINLYTIFMFMCITSWIELIVVLQRLKTFQKTLPDHCPAQPEPTPHEIISNQIVNYLNQITKALFSPNFMIIFLAYHLGMLKAGFIKLIIDIIILLYMLLNRAVGIPSGALMSRRATIAEPDLPHFSTTFLKITNAYIQFLYALLIISCAAMIPCMFKTTCLNTTLTINILFFMIAGFLEYLIITYEKLYLTQGASGKLAFINLFGLLIMIPALWYSSLLPQTYLLLPFIIIRLCSFICIAWVTYKTWNLTPSLQIKTKTILITLLPAIILLAWHLKT